MQKQSLKGKPETGKYAAVHDHIQVAGGSPGWLVAGDVWVGSGPLASDAFARLRSIAASRKQRVAEALA